jgi:hypothetical protein
MWRRETRLADWLSRNRKQESRESAVGFKEKILAKIGQAGFSCAVQDESLTIISPAIDLKAELVARTEIHDGLSKISPGLDSPPLDYDHSLQNVFKSGVYSIGLLGPKNAVRDFRLIAGYKTKIHSGTLQVTPRLHDVSLRERSRNAKTAECRLAGVSPIKSGSQWIIKEAAIKGNLSLMGGQYFTRMSLDIDKLNGSEYQGFLKEAEVLRHIPVDRSELLAVFRSVPIEIISRLQYVADKKTILYTVSNQPQRKQTRLHDLAAIRDIADQEIHLVPHRARYKTVSLVGL